MKLVTFKRLDQISAGVLVTTERGERIIPLAQLDARLPNDLLHFLEMGAAGLEMAKKGLAVAKADAGVALAAVNLQAPLPKPGKIICIGQNYLEHAKEGGAGAAPYPIIFGKFNNTIIGPGAPIVIPTAVKHPDYEGELAVVIGRRGRNIPEAEALQYVGGYMPLNDVSARDWQKRTGQWTIGKTPDTFCPIGPALVTADEIPDPQTLHVRTSIGSELLQDGYTGDMIFPIATLIADMSQVMTLDPGDIIATGTPSGVGSARKPPRWLRPGDVVRIEVEHVGVLENPVVAE